MNCIGRAGILTPHQLEDHESGTGARNLADSIAHKPSEQQPPPPNPRSFLLASPEGLMVSMIIVPHHLLSRRDEACLFVEIFQSLQV